MRSPSGFRFSGAFGHIPDPPMYDCEGEYSSFNKEDCKWCVSYDECKAEHEVDEDEYDYIR